MLKIVWQYNDSVYDVVGETPDSYIIDIKGSTYYIRKEQCAVYEDPEKEAGSVKSDGGSSSYYQLPVPENIIEKIAVNRSVEVEDLIEHVFGNDFDYGNILKSLVRCYKAEQGCGKEGNTLEYECNKMNYSINKIKKRNQEK